MRAAAVTLLLQQLSTDNDVANAKLHFDTEYTTNYSPKEANEIKNQTNARDDKNAADVLRNAVDDINVKLIAAGSPNFDNLLADTLSASPDCFIGAENLLQLVASHTKETQAVLQRLDTESKAGDSIAAAIAAGGNTLEDIITTLETDKTNLEATINNTPADIVVQQNDEAAAAKGVTSTQTALATHKPALDTALANIAGVITFINTTGKKITTHDPGVLSIINKYSGVLTNILVAKMPGVSTLFPTVVDTSSSSDNIEILYPTELGALKASDAEQVRLEGVLAAFQTAEIAAQNAIGRLKAVQAAAPAELNGKVVALTAVNALITAGVDKTQAVLALKVINIKELIALYKVLMDNSAAYNGQLMLLRTSSQAIIKELFVKIKNGNSAGAAAADIVNDEDTKVQSADKLVVAAQSASLSVQIAAGCADSLKSVDDSVVGSLDIVAALIQSFKSDPANTEAILLAMSPVFSGTMDHIAGAGIDTQTHNKSLPPGAAAAHTTLVVEALITAANVGTTFKDFISAAAMQEAAIAGRAVHALNTSLGALSFDVKNDPIYPPKLIEFVVTSLLNTPLVDAAGGNTLINPILAVYNILNNRVDYPDDNDVKAIIKDFKDPSAALAEHIKQIDNTAAVIAATMVNELETIAQSIFAAAASDNFYNHIMGLGEIKRSFVDTLKKPTALDPTIKIGPGASPDIWGPPLWATVFEIVYGIIDTTNGAHAGDLFTTKAHWPKLQSLQAKTSKDLEDLVRWCISAIVFSSADFDYTQEEASRKSKSSKCNAHITAILTAYLAGTGSSYKKYSEEILDFEHPIAAIARDFANFGPLKNLAITPIPSPATLSGDLPADSKAFAATLRALPMMPPLPTGPSSSVSCISWEFSNALADPLNGSTFCHANYGKYLNGTKAKYINELTAELQVKGGISTTPLIQGLFLERLESKWVDENAKWGDIISVLQPYHGTIPAPPPPPPLPKGAPPPPPPPVAPVAPVVSIKFGAGGDAYGVPLSLSSIRGLTDATLLSYMDLTVALVNFADEFAKIDEKYAYSLGANKKYKLLDIYKVFLEFCDACNNFKTTPDVPTFRYLNAKEEVFTIITDIEIPKGHAFFKALRTARKSSVNAFIDFYNEFIATSPTLAPITKLVDNTASSKQSLSVNKKYLTFVNAFNDAVTKIEYTNLSLATVRMPLAAIETLVTNLDTNYYQANPSLLNAQATNKAIMDILVEVAKLPAAYSADPTIIHLLTKNGVFMVDILFEIEKSLNVLVAAADKLLPSNIQLALPPITFDGEGIDSAFHRVLSGSANYPNAIVRGIGGPCSAFYRAMYGRKTPGVITLYQKFRIHQRLEILVSDDLAKDVFDLAWKISKLSYEIATGAGSDPNGAAAEIEKAKTAFPAACTALEAEVNDTAKYPDNIRTTAERTDFSDRLKDAKDALKLFPSLFVGSFVVPVNLFGNNPRTLLTEAQKLKNYATPPTAAFTVAHKASDIPVDSHNDYLIVANSRDELQAMKFHKGGRQVYGLVMDAIRPGDDVTALYKAAAIEIGLHPPPEIKAASANRTKGARGWLFRIVRYTDSDVHRLEPITYINSTAYAVST